MVYGQLETNKNKSLILHGPSAGAKKVKKNKTNANKSKIKKCMRNALEEVVGL